MRFTKAILFSAVSLLLPLMGQATPITHNPNLSVAGLSFSGFGCSLSIGGLGLAAPNNCKQINVNTITKPGNGIQITSGFVAGPLSFDDAVITYDVSAKPGMGINSVGLYFNGTFEGLAVSQVTESVYSGNKLVGFAQVSCDPYNCSRTDNILLDGIYSDLHIEKDILVASVFVDSTISIIDQTFGTVATPEPGSLAMLGAGLLGVAGLLRRRSKLAAAKTANNA